MLPSQDLNNVMIWPFLEKQMDYSRALLSVIHKLTIHTGLYTHMCADTRTWARKPTLAADSKPSSAALSPVTKVIALMGNAKLSSEVISLEISKNGLLELFFFFFKMKSLFSLKDLLQKKQLSPYVFLEGGKRRQNVQAECGLNIAALDSTGG